MTPRAILPRLALALAIAGVAILLAFNRDRIDPVLIESSIRDLGVWAPLGHVILFAIATVLFVPGVIFGLGGGLLFGPLWGTILNLTGAMLGATASFLIARYLAADWVRRKTGGRIERLIAGVFWKTYGEHVATLPKINLYCVPVLRSVFPCASVLASQAQFLPRPTSVR